MNTKNETPAGELSDEQIDEIYFATPMMFPDANKFHRRLTRAVIAADRALRPGAAPAGDVAMQVVAYAYDDPEGAWFEAMPCKRFDDVPPGRARNSEPLVRQADALAAVAAVTAERDAARKVALKFRDERNMLAAKIEQRDAREAMAKAAKS